VLLLMLLLGVVTVVAVIVVIVVVAMVDVDAASRKQIGIGGGGGDDAVGVPSPFDPTYLVVVPVVEIPPVAPHSHSKPGGALPERSVRRSVGVLTVGVLTAAESLVRSAFGLSPIEDFTVVLRLRDKRRGARQ
jgi:hypothetical protein